MRILFLQTSHFELDDRIAFHQRISLEKAGYSCAFASSADGITTIPDIVICDTPVAIWRTRKVFGSKASIVYDITEWYPSKKNLRNTSILLRPIKWCVLVLANLWAGWASNAFIFGEYYKSKPFRLLFPQKKHLFLPYYPSLNYIDAHIPHVLTDEIRLFYAGPQTAEKGYERVQLVAQACQTLMPNKKVSLHTIKDVPFKTFCEEITQQDFFLDLRDSDIENTHCLPIKLFYYMAAGRPIIYSDLKAIRHGVPEIVNDSLVRPNDIERAAQMICELAMQPENYARICVRNRHLAEVKYNWESQHENFLRFIKQIAK